ncbi:MAG: TIGR03435 family protein [Terracidiphilus sp.]
MTIARVHTGRMVASIALFAVVGAVSPIFTSAQSPSPAVTPASQSTTAQRSAAKSTALPSTPTFAVASIRPNNSDHTARTHIYSYADHGHFVAINATPMQLLQYAYVLPDSRILGAPAWAKSSKYDIEGKSDTGLAEQLAALPYSGAKTQLLTMVRSLLADRFRLAAHFENRDLPVYNLVITRKGPKFSPVEETSKHIDTTGRAGSVTIDITSSSHAMADLAEILYRYTGRIVVDKTGLQGNYTINLKFAPDDARLALPSTETSSAPDTGPSVFTAVKEQLGLELKSGKGSIEILVIDHIDPPTEN